MLPAIDIGLTPQGLTKPPSCRRMSGSRVWIVRLPAGVQEPFKVYVNGVPQRAGVDYERRGKRLLFERPLAKEGKLGFWRWFMGAWGIGTYRKDDQVDVAYEVDGHPVVAHALDIEAPPEDEGG
jgi:hypothetical protein